jgi:hypothetical protein
MVFNIVTIDYGCLPISRYEVVFGNIERFCIIINDGCSMLEIIHAQYRE